MRRGIAHLLTICLLGLMSNGGGTALAIESGGQEKNTTPAQAKQSTEAQEAKAAAKAEAAKRRAEARAQAQAKRLQTQQRRVEEHAKRIAAQEKRLAARVAAEQKRFVERAFRQIRQPEGTFKLLGSRLGFGKVVKGAPYSATAISEHTQTLSDGNKIIQKNEATYYRDSEGRTRMDQRLKTIGRWTDPGEPPQIITIFDPVTGNHYSLNSKTRIALLDARGPQRPNPNPKPNPKPNPEAKPNEPNSPGRKNLDGSRQIHNPKEPTNQLISKKAAQDQHAAKESSQRKKKESLGNRVIEGVSAEGTRQTVTIPAGEIGNVAPIEIIDESWYSQDLQVPVMTRHHDPRYGETIYKLTNINRSEPARALFEVPSDYRIVDRRAPRAPARLEQPKIPALPKAPEQPKLPEQPKIPEQPKLRRISFKELAHR